MSSSLESIRAIATLYRYLLTFGSGSNLGPRLQARIRNKKNQVIFLRKFMRRVFEFSKCLWYLFLPHRYLIDIYQKLRLLRVFISVIFNV